MATITVASDPIPEPPNNTKTIRALDDKGNILDWSTYLDDNYATSLAVNWWLEYGDEAHIEVVSAVGERRLFVLPEWRFNLKA